jgi:large subunit ribosomal protein L24
MAATTRRTSAKVPEIRKGDTVVILSGRDAGKRGTVDKVIRVAPAATARKSLYRRRSVAGGTRVVVEGLHIAKRHTKPQQRAGQSDRMPRIQQGGILDIAQPIPASRVMIVCGRCDRPTRVAHTTLDNGTRVRVCRHCGEPLEVKSK